MDSPTFTIIKEYRGRLPFYHMDVYRLESPMRIWGGTSFSGTVSRWWNGPTGSRNSFPITPCVSPSTVGETGDRLITFAPDVERVRRLCRELRRK